MKAAGRAGWLIVGALLVVAPRPAQPSEAVQCAPDDAAACWLDGALRHLEQGDARAALDLVKAAPERVRLLDRHALLTARAYQTLGNAVWARRTLALRVEAAPDDCEARAWLAWLLGTDADLAGARAVLEHPACPGTPEQRARWELLGAWLDEQQGERAVAGARVRRAQQAPRVFDEDRALLDWLAERVEPGREPPAMVRVDLRAGYTSNALLGSPLDPQRSAADFATPLAEAALSASLSSPPWGALRGVIDVDATALGLATARTRDLSYLSLGARPGLQFTTGAVRWRGSYRLEGVTLAGGDAYDEGPLWFYLAHRGEAQVSVGSWLTVLGGAGRRTFRDLGRTRTEVDVSVGGGGTLAPGWSLVGLASGRAFRATNPAWNLFGGTLVGSVQWLPHGAWIARAVLTVAADTYPDSRGTFAATAVRTDLQVKPRIEGWTPAWHGVRAGLSYQWGRRFSTADRYDFDEHRVLGLLRWSFEADPWGPEGVRPAGHEPLDYGLEGSGGLGERVQDLLRQDEEARRGSSCLD